MEITSMQVRRAVDDSEMTGVMLLRPRFERVEIYKITADPGKMITSDGVTLYSCVYTYTPDKWHEVDGPTNEYIEPSEPSESDEISDNEFISMLKEVL